MYYKEYLRARRALVVFIIVAAVLLVISLVGMALGGGVDRKPDLVQWLALLGAAALAASIMATVLGSALAQENDGHLELAWTKPYSRTRYAATAIAIDMAAIVLALLVGFAFILIHIVIGHPNEHLVAGPDAAINALRFALFPLAWYALIVGLSAGTRGRAGVVQGLIWPIALVLVVLRDAPLSAMWHGVFVALNAINPLIYASYQDHGDVAIVGASPLHVVTSTVVLAALVIAGWAAATIQWRRVEA